MTHLLIVQELSAGASLTTEITKANPNRPGLVRVDGGPARKVLSRGRGKAYERNEIACGMFCALGKQIDLAAVRAPIFLLAARDDELVAPEQLFAAARLVGTLSHDICKLTANCRHLSLFMGKQVLQEIWPDIVQWLSTPPILIRKHNKPIGLPSAA